MLPPSRRCTSTLGPTLLAWAAGHHKVFDWLQTDVFVCAEYVRDLMLSRSLCLEGSVVLTLVKMRRIRLACLLLIFVQVQRAVLGTHDVYIVTMEGDPVVSYQGGVEGFPATAVDLDEEMDVTR